ncbi:hypothetical protein F5887DRAFT_986179 [Amanita rubescens]|nr:hypothetical protein F5887DRAFT_995265 [Amanita rubescens]KAF8336716.1 hypothetical protein F5887DRAFT_986179 [Amanita rubescens]
MFFNASLFTTVIVFVVALFGAFATAAPAVIRDVYVPPVIYPGNGTVWKAGSTHNVTWDTSNPPRQITNKMGRIVFSKGGLLLLDTPLAMGFDILLGRQEITVPANTVPGTDYAIVLFGDSGNCGEAFTIVAA